MLGRTLKNFFWNTWDNLGRVISYSLVGSLLNLPLIFAVVLIWGAAKLPPDQFLINMKGPAAVTSVARGAEGKPAEGARPADQKQETEDKSGGKKDEAKDGKKAPLTMSDSEAFDLVTTLALALLLSLSFPSMVVVYSAARRSIEGTADRFFTEIGRGFVEHGLRGLAMFLVNFAVFACFFIALKFYFFYPPLTELPVVRWVALGITAWLFLFFTLMQLYLVPLLVHRRDPFLTIYKRAALLVVDNLAQSVAMGLFSFVALALSTFSLVIFNLLLPGVLAMLHLTSFYVLLRQYEPPDEGKDEAPKKDFSAENETRSWRTIFRPWEG